MSYLTTHYSSSDFQTTTQPDGSNVETTDVSNANEVGIASDFNTSTESTMTPKHGDDDVVSSADSDL